MVSRIGVVVFACGTLSAPFVSVPTAVVHPFQSSLPQGNHSTSGALDQYGDVKASGDSGAEGASIRMPVHYVERREMPFPLSIDDAVKFLESVDEEVVELSYSGGEVHGGIRIDPTLTARKNLEIAEESFLSDYGVSPVITGVSFVSKSHRGRSRSLFGDLVSEWSKYPSVDEPTAKWDSSESPLPSMDHQTSQDRERVKGGQRWQGHFPNNWSGRLTRARTGGVKTTSWFRWDGDHSVYQVPRGWGIEMGIQLEDEYWRNLGVRPVCVMPERSNRGFYSNSFNLGYSQWRTNVPRRAEPYVDSWIDSDVCNVNSLEAGIRFPRKLKNTDTYFLQVVTGKGWMESSWMWSAMSFKQDNCVKDFVSPEYCMGLNTEAEMPNDLNSVRTFVNRVREWRAPGCWTMNEGMERPTATAPGRTDPHSFYCPKEY